MNSDFEISRQLGYIFKYTMSLIYSMTFLPTYSIFSARS